MYVLEQCIKLFGEKQIEFHREIDESIIVVRDSNTSQKWTDPCQYGDRLETKLLSGGGTHTGVYRAKYNIEYIGLCYKPIKNFNK